PLLQLLFCPRSLPRSTLFPYTTLFRSRGSAGEDAARRVPFHGVPAHPRAALGDGTGGVPAPGGLFLRLRRSGADRGPERRGHPPDRKSTRLNSSHVKISYAVFCLKKKK